VVVLGGVGLNYVLLQAEFVAVTQFLVYLGAIIVLFLFGVMLTRAPLGVSEDLDNNQKKIGIGVGVALLAVLSYALIESFGRSELTFEAYEGVAGANSNGRTQAVSDAIFGQYLIPFEMLSLLLLAALIGAIVLARRD
jgi:NADH-quinone oxidoreductase subunit J